MIVIPNESLKPSLKFYKRKTNSPLGAMNAFTQWKHDIIDQILANDVICKLLKYPTEDALRRESLTEDEKFNMVDSQIYGYRFVPEVIEEKRSYISLGLGGFAPQESFRQFSNRFAMGVVYFYILVDVDIMKTDDGYRQDLLLAALNQTFQGTSFMGIGELKLFTMDELWQQDNKFGGYQLGFEVVDFR